MASFLGMDSLGSVTRLQVSRVCSEGLTRGVLASLLILLGGCFSGQSTACSGLVYKESGLDRKEYLPCAQAMVDELDRYHQELRTMGDRSLSMKERQEAHRRCLASNARLTGLIREAGGKEKLAFIKWDDATLSRINYNIITARDVYLTYCYYGPIDRPFDVDPEDPSHAAARREVEELR